MGQVGKPGVEPEAAEVQPDLFGAKPPLGFDPDPEKVRARLAAILAEARAAKFLPWDAERLAHYRNLFPQMADHLPGKEAKRLRREFEKQLARLAAH